MDKIGVTAIVEYEYTAKEPDELDLAKGAIIHSIKQMPGGWWEGTLNSNGKTGMFPDNFVRIIDTTNTLSASSEEIAVTLRDKSATKNRRCKVIYSYTQVNDDELSLAVGDVIEFLGEVEEGWWRGRLKTKVGVFPSNFVVDIEPSPVFASKRPTSTAVGNTAATSATANNSAAATASALANAALAAVTTKKSNRLSFHNSKEDLLGGNSSINTNSITASTKTTSTTTAASASAVVSSTNEDAAPVLPPKPQREYCRVEFPYAPQNDDELELKVGDVITIITTDLPDKGWWKGELRGKIGVFPDNFVKMMAPPDVPVRSKINTKIDSTSNTNSTAKAISANKYNNSNIHNTRTLPTILTTTTNATTTKAAASEKAPIEMFGARMASFINTFFIPTGNEAALHSQQQQQHQQPQQSTQHSNKTAKISKKGMSSTTATSLTTAATATTTNHTATSSTTVTQSQSSKVVIKKSGSTSSTQSSNRKDSFGSYDSLNDILSETGLQSGNVAAQRKSLENKNLDITNVPDAGIRMGLKKQQQQQQQETSTTKPLNSSSCTTTTATTTSPYGALITTTNELRKSIENMDDKSPKTTPPPVLTKKPNVPTKKSTTSNIFTSLKSKAKNIESILTTSASTDAADGIGSSKLSPPSGGVLPDAAPSGNLVMRRAATIAVEDSDFDRVERASILPDMRAGRVKAPKRRPPSTAINAIGETNNNNAIYVNGSSNNITNEAIDETSQQMAPTHSSDDNSTGEEQLAKPKPREWEKKKAPWMEELKASQVKKKTSPSVEPRGGASVGSEVKISNNSATTSSSSSSSVTKVQSSSISSSSTIVASSSTMQKSMLIDGNNKEQITATNSNNHSNLDAMSKSFNSKITTTTTSNAETAASTTVATVDDVRAARPNSLSIRNRGTSPTHAVGSGSSVRSALKSTNTTVSSSPGDGLTTSHSTSSNTAAKTHSTTHSTHVNNHQHHNATHVTHNGGDGRIVELERRIEKLEGIVNTQQLTIEDLVRTLHEETARVKVLRGELDKYAHFHVHEMICHLIDSLE